MEPRTINIKNMVCDRCITAVEALFIDNGYTPVSVKLGQATIIGNGKGLVAIATSLQTIGFELIQKPGQVMVERIKNTIRDLVRSGKLENLHVNMSAYLEQELGKDYSTLTHLFGNYESTSLERFTIMQKVEQAKEWLQTEPMSMAEIAARLGYSSAAYFSNQFRQVTGLTPSGYKNQQQSSRLPIDTLSDRGKYVL